MRLHIQEFNRPYYLVSIGEFVKVWFKYDAIKKSIWYNREILNLTPDLKRRVIRILSREADKELRAAYMSSHPRARK